MGGSDKSRWVIEIKAIYKPKAGEIYAFFGLAAFFVAFLAAGFFAAFLAGLAAFLAFLAQNGSIYLTVIVHVIELVYYVICYIPDN